MVSLPDTEYTMERTIRRAAEAFERHQLHYGHGTDSATHEASWLILFGMRLSPAIAPDYSQKLSSAQVSTCNALLSRRIEERIPAACLTGQVWFAWHPFLSDERALIPRSPLAEFINDDFFGVLDGTENSLILDLCTGGGCIAIACAYARTDAEVDASDLSADALALAAENVQLHGMTDRVTLFEGSLFEPLSRPLELRRINQRIGRSLRTECLAATRTMTRPCVAQLAGYRVGNCATKTLAGYCQGFLCAPESGLL